jgi:hypothetical protein
VTSFLCTDREASSQQFPMTVDLPSRLARMLARFGNWKRMEAPFVWEALLHARRFQTGGRETLAKPHKHINIYHYYLFLLIFIVI